MAHSVERPDCAFLRIRFLSLGNGAGRRHSAHARNCAGSARGSDGVPAAAVPRGRNCLCSALRGFSGHVLPKRSKQGGAFRIPNRRLFLGPVRLFRNAHCDQRQRPHYTRSQQKPERWVASGIPRRRGDGHGSGRVRAARHLRVVSGAVLRVPTRFFWRNQPAAADYRHHA